MIPVQYFFVLSALLFFIGVYGFCTRRNLVAMLISIELVLNAADLNFAVFNRILFPGQLAYSQSASLLAHNQITAPQFIRRRLHAS